MTEPQTQAEMPMVDGRKVEILAFENREAAEAFLRTLAPQAESDDTTLRAGCERLVGEWRKRSENAERLGRFSFPEGYAAEAKAFEECADELSALLAEGK